MIKLVLPCFNEAARLPVASFKDFLAANADFRLLFVNDGSTDQTLQVLNAMQAALPEQVEVVDLVANVGKAEAVRRGVLSALAGEARDLEFFGYWDADLATPLAAAPEFARLLAEREGLCLVTGARVKLFGRQISRKPQRHVVGRLFATAASGLLLLPFYDSQCGAKLFRVDAATRQIFAEPFQTRWLFDLELLLRLRAHERRPLGLADMVREIPLERWEDVDGSKVTAREFFRAALELSRLFFRSRRPALAPGRTAPPPVEEA